MEFIKNMFKKLFRKGSGTSAKDQPQIVVKEPEPDPDEPDTDHESENEEEEDEENSERIPDSESRRSSMEHMTDVQV